MRREEAYPVRLVDRPLLIPPGTTQADPSFQLQTGIDDYVDSGGIERRRRVTAWGVDLSGRGAAGPVEIGVGVGSRVRLEGAVGLLDGDKAGDLTLDAGFDFTLAFFESNDQYFYTQYLGTRFKAVRIAHELAVIVGARMSFNQAQTEDHHVTKQGDVLDGDGFVTVQWQLAKHLCLLAAPYWSVPLWESGTLDPHPTIAAHGGFVATSWKWDFFASLTVLDIAHDRSEFVNVGFAKRWPP
jgi:hypothetical protein